jgi:hypothetical protein
MIKIEESPVGWVKLTLLPDILKLSRVTFDRRIKEDDDLAAIIEQASKDFSKSPLFVRAADCATIIQTITLDGVKLEIIKKAVKMIEQPTGFVSKRLIPSAMGISKKQYDKLISKIFEESPEFKKRYQGGGKKWDVCIKDARYIIEKFTGRPDDNIFIED